MDWFLYDRNLHHEIVNILALFEIEFDESVDIGLSAVWKILLLISRNSSSYVHERAVFINNGFIF